MKTVSKGDIDWNLFGDAMKLYKDIWDTDDGTAYVKSRELYEHYKGTKYEPLARRMFPAIVLAVIELRGERG